MTVAPGTRLGPYEVVSPIGAGGMGEVWRATDTRLDRSVAIKILPEGFAQNEQFRARFEREAKTISSLNHPHICTLFDVGHDSGAHYLVMELLEGESLADRLARGPLPPDQVLKYGAQIAEALDRAHRQGIVHRDLKPGNVMLTKSGAKLLDFGLARSSSESAPLHGLTDMATQARPLTQEGTILGTFQYMAPEQLEGLEADARTDIFAFGALLYEMATGRRAFEGASRTSLIAAIVSSQPAPISSVTPMTPPALDHVVRKCLEKDPDDRWQSAHDVAGELRWIGEAGSQAGVAAPITMRRRTRERLAWALAALAGALAVAAVTMLLLRREPPRRAVESSIVMPEGTRLALGFGGGLAISPDGAWLAFVLVDAAGGAPTLWLRPLASGAWRQLAGTEDASQPFWSPDSKKVGFFAGGKLKTVDLQGGSVAVVSDAPAARGAAWRSDGTIVLSPAAHGPLTLVKAAGGTPVALTKLRPGETSHRWPVFLPDGETILFVVMNETDAKSAVSRISIDEPEKIEAIVPANYRIAWVEPGIILHSRDSRLLAQRYDAGRGRTMGDPVTVSDRFIHYAAAADGTLVLQRNPNLVLSQMVWVDRNGKEESSLAPPGLFFSPALSRDGRRLAVDLSNALDGQGDIWVYDLTRGSATRLTYADVNESAPQWSPDGRTVFFYAGTARGGSILEVPSGGTGTPRPIVEDEREKRPTGVSPDGKWIVYNSVGSANSDVWVWSAADKQSRSWLSTPFREQCAQFSPDGKWIAYQSDESGRWEVYVRAFPESDRKWLISNAGGIMPHWRGDGRELYYLSLDEKMTAVTVTPGPELEVSAPVPLFTAPLRHHPTIQYTVSADGRRFLLNRRVESAAIEPVTLLQNWDLRVPEP